MAKNQRTDTREFEIEAVQFLERTGNTYTEIEREWGIRSRRLSRWKKECGKQGEEAFPGSGSRDCPAGGDGPHQPGLAAGLRTQRGA